MVQLMYQCPVMFPVIINIEFNQTGMTDILVDFTGYVNVEITGLDFKFINTEKSTNISVSADLIQINGNADIFITPGYIKASIGTGGKDIEGDTKYSSGIVLQNFLLNANVTLGSKDLKVIAEFELLDIVSGVTIAISDGITISTSADLTGKNIYIVTESDSQGIFISADVDLFEITGGGGGTIVIDKITKLISGSAINTNFVLENVSIDAILPSVGYSFIVIEDLDLSLAGSDVQGFD